MAVVAAEQLVSKLVDSVHTPPRSPEPCVTSVLVSRFIDLGSIIDLSTCIYLSIYLGRGCLFDQEPRGKYMY